MWPFKKKEGDNKDVNERTPLRRDEKNQQQQAAKEDKKQAEREQKDARVKAAYEELLSMPCANIVDKANINNRWMHYEEDDITAEDVLNHAMNVINQLEAPDKKLDLLQKITPGKSPTPGNKETGVAHLFRNEDRITNRLREMLTITQKVVEDKSPPAPAPAVRKPTPGPSRN